MEPAGCPTGPPAGAMRNGRTIGINPGYASPPPALYQPALFHRRPDEGREQRVRRKRSRFQLGMELDADEPGMILVLDHLRQETIGRHAAEAHPVLLEAAAIVG